MHILYDDSDLLNCIPAYDHTMILPLVCETMDIHREKAALFFIDD